MGRTAGATVAMPSPDSARAKAWTVMRNFGQRREDFTVQDLIVRIRDDFGDRVSPSNLQKYCRQLDQCGYLRLTGGCQGHDKSFRLQRDTGPVCPVVRRDGSSVYDPNKRCEYRPEETS